MDKFKDLPRSVKCKLSTLCCVLMIFVAGYDSRYFLMDCQQYSCQDLNDSVVHSYLPDAQVCHILLDLSGRECGVCDCNTDDRLSDMPALRLQLGQSEHRRPLWKSEAVLSMEWDTEPDIRRHHHRHADAISLAIAVAIDKEDISVSHFWNGIWVSNEFIQGRTLSDRSYQNMYNHHDSNDRSIEGE
jgi:hypothetical protein